MKTFIGCLQIPSVTLTLSQCGHMQNGKKTAKICDYFFKITGFGRNLSKDVMYINQELIQLCKSIFQLLEYKMTLYITRKLEATFNFCPVQT